MSDSSKPPNKRRRGWCGCIWLIILLPLFYYGVYLVLRGPLPDQPQVIAHRGGTVDTPENTLAAFRNAIVIGADWLEFDVQRTSDGVMVVFHDDTVDRTTDGTGRLTDMTFDQVRSLDAGQGEKVPTLAEVIDLAKTARIGILPEPKFVERAPGLPTELVKALEAAGYLDNAVIQSFPVEPLDEIRAANPQAQVCRLSGLWGLSLRNLQPADAEAACPMAEMVLLNPWMIRQAHQDGRIIFPYFGIIEHPYLMRVLLFLGVDGLMVDDPAALRQIIQ